MSKIVLITGASGLIGKALMKSLLDQGYFIHTLTTQKPKTSSKPNVKEFYWNPIGNEIDLQGLEDLSGLTRSLKQLNKAFKPKVIPHSSAAEELIPEPIGRSLSISQSNALNCCGLIFEIPLITPKT